MASAVRASLDAPSADRAPELVVDGARRAVRHAAAIDPEQEALLADSVGLALLVVLETLAPAERVAFVLHDMFAVPLSPADARRRLRAFSRWHARRSHRSCGVLRRLGARAGCRRLEPSGPCLDEGT